MAVEKIRHSAREEIKIHAVQRILDGESPEVVAKTLGYHRSAVYQWLARYRECGFEGLKYRNISGKQPSLGKMHKQKIFDIVTSKNPLQLKLAFALWTRAMVKDLILDQFAVSLSKFLLVVGSVRIGFIASPTAGGGNFATNTLECRWIPGG